MIDYRRALRGQIRRAGRQFLTGTAGDAEGSRALARHEGAGGAALSTLARGDRRLSTRW